MDSRVILTLFEVTLINIYVGAISTYLRGSGDVALANSHFTFICDVTSGNIASVVFLKEKTLIASVSYINGKCKHKDPGELCSTDICSCDGTRSYNSTLTPILETWHNTAWNCDSTHGGAFSNTYKLYVSVAVTAATIFPAVVELDVVAGRLTQFACTSQPASRPNATITWYRRSKDGHANMITDGVTTKFISVGDRNLTVTNSSLFYNPVKNENGFYLYCSTKSEYSMAITSDKILLNVLFHPGAELTLVTNPPMEFFELNLALEIICEIAGGNPLATLRWTCDNADLGERVLDVSTNYSAIVKLMVIINSSEFDGQRCICTATHLVDSFLKSKQFVFKLKVPSTAENEKQNVSDNNSDTGKSTVGIVIGVIAGIFILIIIIVFMVRWIRQRKGNIEITNIQPRPATPIENVHPMQGMQTGNEENVQNGYDIIENGDENNVTRNESNDDMETRDFREYLAPSAKGTTTNVETSTESTDEDERPLSSSGYDTIENGDDNNVTRNESNDEMETREEYLTPSAIDDTTTNVETKAESTGEGARGDNFQWKLKSNERPLSSSGYDTIENDDDNNVTRNESNVEEEIREEYLTPSATDETTTNVETKAESTDEGVRDERPLSSSGYDTIENDDDNNVTRNESNVEEEIREEYLTASANDTTTNVETSTETTDEGVREERPLSSRRKRQKRKSSSERRYNNVNSGNLKPTPKRQPKTGCM